MNTPSQTTDSKPLEIRRGRVASVDLYEVKDSELDLLEKGSPATIQLNFAVFLISLAFSSIAALCTATFKWDIAQTVFVFVAVIGIFMGAYLLITWWRTRTSITSVVRAIRLRIEVSDLAPKKSAASPAAPAAPEKENEPAG